EPPLDMLLALGVHLQAIKIVLQLAGGFADLNERLLHQRRSGAELGIERGQALQGRKRPADARMGAALVLFEKLQQRGLRARAEAAMIGEARALLGELVELAWRKLQRLKLLRVVAQKLKARLALVHPRLKRQQPIHD